MSRPLILEFFEQPSDDLVVDNQAIEYDNELQLSVLKGSKTPAFDALNLRTATNTGSLPEPTDSDYSSLNNVLHTHTYSANNTEATDNDDDLDKIQGQLATQTITLVNSEVVDDDASPKFSDLGTMTMTKAGTEGTDSDI